MTEAHHIPQLSIIMPAYNAERFIEDSVRSVLTQSYRDFELIVVDDGSRDNTAAIVRRLAEEDARIVLIQQQNSGKPSIARNAGIQQARGELLSFLDDDDRYKPGHLETLFDTFQQHPDAALIFADKDLIDEHGKVIKASYNRSLGFPDNFPDKSTLRNDAWLLSDTFVLFQSQRPSYMQASAILMRRQSVIEEAGFDTGLVAGEDIDLFWKLLYGKPSIYIDRALGEYRKYGSSLTTSGDQTLNIGFVRARELFLQRHPEIPASVKNLLARQIADTCVAISYARACEGETAASMRYIRKALDYRCTPGILWRGVRHLLRSFR